MALYSIVLPLKSETNAAHIGDEGVAGDVGSSKLEERLHNSMGRVIFITKRQCEHMANRFLGLRPAAFFTAQGWDTVQHEIHLHSTRAGYSPGTVQFKNGLQ